MKAGDYVYHKPSGETWVVAYRDGEYLGYCGWPPGEAKVADCQLVKSCTKEEHLALLEALATAGSGKRAQMAKQQLEKYVASERHRKKPEPNLQWEERCKSRSRFGAYRKLRRYRTLKAR